MLTPVSPGIYTVRYLPSSGGSQITSRTPPSGRYPETLAHVEKVAGLNVAMSLELNVFPTAILKSLKELTEILQGKIMLIKS